MLPTALGQALKQDWQDFEIIVADDGSDPPVDAAVFDDERIRIIRHPTNQGAAAARNSAVLHARGQFIAFLDSDDEWLPNKLSTQLAYMQSNPNIKASTTGFYYLTDEGASLELPKAKRSWHRFIAQGMGLSPGTTLMVYRACMHEYPFDTQLARYEDLDWALRFTQKYQFGVVRQPLAVIHRGARPPAELVERSNLIILEKHGGDFRQMGWFYGRMCVGKRYLEIATHYFREKNNRRGWKYLLMALKENPIQRPGMYLRIFDYLLGTNLLKTIKSARLFIQNGLYRGFF